MGIVFLYLFRKESMFGKAVGHLVSPELAGLMYSVSFSLPKALSMHAEHAKCLALQCSPVVHAPGDATLRVSHHMPKHYRYHLAKILVCFDTAP